MGYAYLEIDSDTDGLARVLADRGVLAISSAFESTQKSVDHHSDNSLASVVYEYQYSTLEVALDLDFRSCFCHGGMGKCNYSTILYCTLFLEHLQLYIVINLRTRKG